MIIYCDMDGVLTDLFGAVGAQTGETYTSNFPAMKALVRLKRKFKSQPGFAAKFWEDLPWTTNGKKVWASILRYKPLILTGAIGNIGAGEGKSKWAARELGYQASKVILSKKKWEYAGNGNILIDDLPHNIEKWEAAGGIGVLHHDSTYQQTIAKVQELMSKSESVDLRVRRRLNHLC